MTSCSKADAHPTELSRQCLGVRVHSLNLGMSEHNVYGCMIALVYLPSIWNMGARKKMPVVHYTCLNVDFGTNFGLDSTRLHVPAATIKMERGA